MYLEIGSNQRTGMVCFFEMVYIIDWLNRFEQEFDLRRFRSKQHSDGGRYSVLYF